MQSYSLLPAPLVTDTQKISNNLPHVMFEHWVDQCPSEIAVLNGGDRLSYAELESRANQIAHALRHAGVQKGDIVALLLERGPDLVCALLGALKSGAAFTALDPRTPKEALVRILATVQCPFVLTRSTLTPNLPPTSATSLFLEDPAWLAGQPASRPEALTGPDDPACVLFTSGSTAHPKAVMYLHRNLAVRFTNIGQVSNFRQSSVFAQSSPVTSIDALDEILVSLVSGGCTTILPYSTVTSPHQLIDALSVQRVTHMLLVPSLLRVILSAGENLDQKLAALRTWIIGGEPLTAALLSQFYAQLPKAVLINFYGLTEGDATCHVTSPAFQYDTSVPIGQPVQHTKVYLLDENLKPVPAGEPGEICLSGRGLFHQYLNCPELNAERWMSNPFEARDSYARLFRTGDMGRLRADGTIEYLGRRDRMVKIRGFRVELGEVEAVLLKHPAVEECVVVASQLGDHSQGRLAQKTQLTAYAVLKRGVTAAAPELREFLKDRLPHFAVPAAVLIIDSFPLSPNGKVDIPALSRMKAVERTSGSTYVPPRNAVELKLTQIWEDLLKRKPIGRGDNFFEIGGDSLAAIDLMLTLEKEFQRNLPITVLFQSPTIAALAELLQSDGTSVIMDSLIPIRVQGSQPPLFCVHADGSVFIYRRFVNYLDPNIPLYGLQAHGLASPKHEPYRHIDQMASHYIREIRVVQPHGPYHLCAFSAGGLIIFEMARQLHELGEEVAFLGLLDAYGPDYPQYLPRKTVAAYKISVHLNTLRLYGIKGQMSYLWKKIRHQTNIGLSRVFARMLKFHVPMPRKIRYEYIARLIDDAAQIYPRGRTYAGDAVLFHAATQPEGIKPDASLGWLDRIKGELRVVDVTGTHTSIMTLEPHLAELVRKIDDQLRQLHSPLAPESASTEKLPLSNPASMNLN